MRHRGQRRRHSSVQAARRQGAQQNPGVQRELSQSQSPPPRGRYAGKTGREHPRPARAARGLYDRQGRWPFSWWELFQEYRPRRTRLQHLSAGAGGLQYAGQRQLAHGRSPRRLYRPPHPHKERGEEPGRTRLRLRPGYDRGRCSEARQGARTTQAPMAGGHDRGRLLHPIHWRMSIGTSRSTRRRPYTPESRSTCARTSAS